MPMKYSLNRFLVKPQVTRYRIWREASFLHILFVLIQPGRLEPISGATNAAPALFSEVRRIKAEYLDSDIEPFDALSSTNLLSRSNISLKRAFASSVWFIAQPNFRATRRGLAKTSREARCYRLPYRTPRPTPRRWYPGHTTLTSALRNGRLRACTMFLRLSAGAFSSSFLLLTRLES